MKVSIDGKTYEYDRNKLLFSEAAFVQKKTGLKMLEWQRGLGEMDAFAVAALVYILRMRAGEGPVWDDLEFDMASLAFDSSDEDEDEVEAPKEAAPASSGTATS